MSLSPLKYFESLYPENTREDEIKEYLEFLKKGLSAQIIGLPGTGKNNLLRLLAYNLKAREYHLGKYEKVTHFVYMDAGEAKDRPLKDLIKLALSAIFFSLGERGMSLEAKTVKTLLTEAASMNDEFLMFQYLKRAVDFLTIEKRLTLILLFDRFNFVANSITEEFFINLKSLRNNSKYRFGVVFSLTRPLEETVDESLISDFSDIISHNEIYIALSDPVALKFRTEYIQKAARKNLPQEIIDNTIHLTGGHAKLTKLSLENLVSEKDLPENLKRHLAALPTIIKALKEMTDSLLPSEILALKNSSETLYLEKVGLTEKGSVKIPLLKEYVDNLKIEDSEKITYDEDKNEILKGENPLTHLLSPSEFRLLKFMISNKEKVLSKDEIINSVWNDTKSQEGVSDEAFDQIIYRLRKKIESDPKNPNIIKTIKGTGYKLS